MADNRRRYERFTVDVPCRLVIPDDHGGTRFEAFAKLKDISLGGAFVTSGVRFKDDTADVLVELRFPGGVIPVHGKIIRQPDGGMAIAFSDVSLKEREALLEHAAPERYRRFYEEAVVEIKPPISAERVSLILHLWEEWTSGALKKRESASTRAPAKSSGPAAKPRVTRR